MCDLKSLGLCVDVSPLDWDETWKISTQRSCEQMKTRNRLKYALTRDEVWKICRQQFIKIDGKVRTDITYPASSIDVIGINKTGENVCLIYDTKGRFAIHPITPEEATSSCANSKNPILNPSVDKPSSSPEFVLPDIFHPSSKGLIHIIIFWADGGHRGWTGGSTNLQQASRCPAPPRPPASAKKRVLSEENLPRKSFIKHTCRGKTFKQNNREFLPTPGP
ncbi:hypothetical protein HPG69_005446 [Diceros bicornis minor]|uniref:Small ribosomal subunit protein eS4 central region domain-containing protein n=1 Tax=Diceros bicornis minor TaxID=77932 RepID=A0A7J7ELY2_DICBM|nr:hypothetical protein HPG69_005446 [Diceros bicornis minor]